MSIFTAAPKTRIGVVEDTQLTFGSAGHQWTTIDGVRYATYWNWHTRDWKEGDTVVFEAFRGRLMGQSTKTLQAEKIRKAQPEDYPKPTFWKKLANTLKTLRQ